MKTAKPTAAKDAISTSRASNFHHHPHPHPQHFPIPPRSLSPTMTVPPTPPPGSTIEPRGGFTVFPGGKGGNSVGGAVPSPDPTKPLRHAMTLALARLATGDEADRIIAQGLLREQLAASAPEMQAGQPSPYSILKAVTRQPARSGDLLTVLALADTRLAQLDDQLEADPENFGLRRQLARSVEAVENVREMVRQVRAEVTAEQLGQSKAQGREQGRVLAQDENQPGKDGSAP